MHEMRKTGGYMTVEISALLPIILMVLWMFFSYLFYFMNCGIAQGIMEEAVQKAADVKITGAEYDTGKLSYQKVNQKLITGNVISSNKSGNTKAEKEMKEQLRRHLFMAGFFYLLYYYEICITDILSPNFLSNLLNKSHLLPLIFIS